MNRMQVDPDKMHVRDVYQLMIGCITPRPIAWVSTLSPNGVANLAPFSFFTGVTAKPPTVVFSPVNKRDGSKKDTIKNIEQLPEFVVNVVSFDLAAPMNQSSAEYDYEVSEFEACGLTQEPSVKIKPPRVKGAKVQMECTLEQIVKIGEGALAANLVIGRIQLLHIADEVLNEDGKIDPVKLDTIGRMGGTGYTRTTNLFEIDRPKL